MKPIVNLPAIRSLPARAAEPARPRRAGEPAQREAAVLLASAPAPRSQGPLARPLAVRAYAEARALQNEQPPPRFSRLI